MTDLSHLNDLREQLSAEDRQRFAAWLQELYRRTFWSDHSDPRTRGINYAISVLSDDA